MKRRLAAAAGVRRVSMSSPDNTGRPAQAARAGTIFIRAYIRTARATISKFCVVLYRKSDLEAPCTFFQLNSMRPNAMRTDLSCVSVLLTDTNPSKPPLLTIPQKCSLPGPQSPTHHTARRALFELNAIRDPKHAGMACGGHLSCVRGAMPRRPTRHFPQTSSSTQCTYGA